MTRRRRIAFAAIVSVAAIVGGIAAIGGFADVPDESQPVFSLGETFENELYSITVESIDVTDVDPLSGVEADTPFVVASVELLFSGESPPRLAYEWLTPLDLEIVPLSGGLISVRDGSLEPPIQPGLAVEVLYFWHLADGTDTSAGDEVALGIYERYVDVTNPIADATTGRALVGIVESRS